MILISVVSVLLDCNDGYSREEIAWAQYRAGVCAAYAYRRVNRSCPSDVTDSSWLTEV